MPAGTHLLELHFESGGGMARRGGVAGPWLPTRPNSTRREAGLRGAPPSPGRQQHWIGFGVRARLALPWRGGAPDRPPRFLQAAAGNAAVMSAPGHLSTWAGARLISGPARLVPGASKMFAWAARPRNPNSSTPVPCGKPASPTACGTPTRVSNACPEKHLCRGHGTSWAVRSPRYSVRCRQPWPGVWACAG
jgi:hypothetical protein